MKEWLIYGATGYTGELLAREAIGTSLSPHLAGRDPEKLRGLAARLNATNRPTWAFGMDDPVAVRQGLEGIGLVVNCAGPFTRTALPMVQACLELGVDYFDVTGEIAVFESLAALDGQARQRGTTVMPGIGFDVVPSDCLAAHMKSRIPSANQLTLGFQSLGRFSRGTATTMAENIHRGGAIRKDGKLTRVQAAYRTRVIDFGNGPTQAMTIPWGDVSTAFRTTDIPNIEVYTAVSSSLLWAARVSRYLGWLLSSGPVQRYLKRRIQAGPPGPSEEERARGKSYLWGEASDPAGQRVVSRLQGPEGYTFTVLTALAVVRRALAGPLPHGYQTPGRVFGPDFVLSIPGVIRTDE
jgi:short subunit dehydrogenase-like uncharacterized protein